MTPGQYGVLCYVPHKRYALVWMDGGQVLHVRSRNIPSLADASFLRGILNVSDMDVTRVLDKPILERFERLRGEYMT